MPEQSEQRFTYDFDEDGYGGYETVTQVIQPPEGDYDLVHPYLPDEPESRDAISELDIMEKAFSCAIDVAKDASNDPDVMGTSFFSLAPAKFNEHAPLLQEKGFDIPLTSDDVPSEVSAHRSDGVQIEVVSVIPRLTANSIEEHSAPQEPIVLLSFSPVENNVEQI